MKRIAAILSVLFTALTLSVSAFALDENLLGDYNNVLWENAQLLYNPEHYTFSFADEAGEAWVDFPVEDALALWFYADCGGYNGKGNGSVGIVFYSENGEVLGEYEKTFVSDGYFYRFQLGTEDGYLPIPENAQSVRVILKSDGEESVYFRTPTLKLSRTAARSDAADWVQSGKLEAVQVKTTAAHYWFWVAIVAAVPIIMIGMKKVLEKAKKI